MKCPYINPTIQQCMTCPLPDCVKDKLTTDEYKSDEVDRFIADKPSDRVIKQRIASREYMRRIRAANPNFDKEYYRTHREQEIKRNSEAKKKNREYYNTYQRERYARNREEMCRKRREYRARKKAERVS